LAYPVISQFIQRLPKAELHVHLEGSVDAATLLELSRRHDTVPLDAVAVEQLYRYGDFAGFLNAFKEVTARLRTPEDFALITERLLRRLRAQNVRHAEIIFSAGICLWRKQDVDAIFAAIEQARERVAREIGISVLWIWDAVRQFGVDAAMHVVEAAAAHRGQNAVAFGIGGDERAIAAEEFREVYATARRSGLRLTMHAGESGGPEAVWGALNLGAERIGHGINAALDAELVEVLAERQIPLEISITSNLRTGCCAAIERHPVRQLFDEGVMITLNSDDPEMFGTSLEREYAIAQQAFGFTDEHLRELARNSFEASFLAPGRKLEFLNAVDE
jgi:adenosine deaminase/aminodeoxyfutalosine deaminase